MSLFSINLGCLHPVARVISDDVGFNPSTQHHYRRLIYYLYIFQPHDGRTTETCSYVYIFITLFISNQNHSDSIS
jgi:hypothetical protein